MQHRAVLKWAGACLVVLAFQLTSFGAAVAPYDTGGFESPRFHVGVLDSSQDVASGATWATSAPLTTAAQVTTFGDATQGVAVTMLDATNGTGGYWWPSVPVSPGSGVVAVTWDMFVRSAAMAGVYSTEGDPFFGITAFDQSGNRLATMGVNAANGALAVSDSPSTTNEYAGLFTDTLDTWHSYALTLDYSTKVFHVFVDGVERGTGFNFVTPASTNFGDADINAFGLTNPINNQTSGLAYFDNLVVAPEPTSLALLVCSFGLLATRRRQV